VGSLFLRHSVEMMVTNVAEACTRQKSPWLEKVRWKSKMKPRLQRNAVEETKASY